MKLLDEWTDDHLPCVSFEHGDYKFEVCWTERSLIGRLDLVEEGEVTLEKALKNYPGLLKVIQSPLTCTFDNVDEGETECDVGDDTLVEYNCDAGWVNVFKKDS